ncbi:MAG: prephenate dehydrogenase/arogenate dehydrogenase family protein [Candidatus Dadabacteria bacterium]|nr:MAG: prephenate dehydrogenase/arogenate dehydrogenase family protein [Candidatus Dadabacteria bacterium]
MQVAIIGVGLIGGSLGLRLRQSGFASEVVGCGRSSANLETALQLGCVDRYTHQPLSAVTGADLVVVATPVRTVGAIFEAIAPEVTEHTVVTDVGSVKQSVVAQAARLPFPRRFVGGHPIAGTEDSGAAAADADLFEDARWIITPEGSDADAIDLVAGMVGATGAQLERMSAARHDEIFAWVSHLPHLLAFALGEALRQMDPGLLSYGGGGLRDFMRIAASDPVMWRDIFEANQPALMDAASVFDRILRGLIEQISSDSEAVAATLEQVRALVRAARETT